MAAVTRACGTISMVVCKGGTSFEVLTGPPAFPLLARAASRLKESLSKCCFDLSGSHAHRNEPSSSFMKISGFPSGPFLSSILQTGKMKTRVAGLL